MKPVVRFGLALTSILLLALAARTSTAEPQAWDQAAVTELAKQLAESAGDLRTSVRQTPTPQTGSARRAYFQILDDLRVVSNSINSLASRLESGEDRSQTYPTFRRIRMLRDDVEEQARRIDLGEPTISKLDTAQALLGKLSPYFEAEESS